MFRKSILAATAALALGTVALVPGTASAHWYGWYSQPYAYANPYWAPVYPRYYAYRYAYPHRYAWGYRGWSHGWRY